MPERYEPPEVNDEWADADDPEGPQECDLVDQDSDETPTLPCPNCRQAVPEIVDRCPHCGDWIVPSTAAAGGRSPWLAVFMVLLAAGLLFLWLR